MKRKHLKRKIRQQAKEIRQLHRFAMQIASRLAAASEVLGHLAEKKRKS